jgi:threonine aldolase
MRQAGVLAAAGLIALEKMPARLGEDHANAQWLAGQLAGMPGIGLDAGRVVTNIVIFDVAGTGLNAGEFCKRLKARGVLMIPFGPTLVRAVTHYDAPRTACEGAVEQVRELLRSL